MGRSKVARGTRKEQVSLSLTPFEIYVLDKESETVNNSRSEVASILVKGLAQQKGYTDTSPSFIEWLRRNQYIPEGAEQTQRGGSPNA